MTYKELQSYFAAWSKQTYGSGLKYYYKVADDSDTFNYCIKIMDMVGIVDRLMDGSSTQRLNPDNRYHTGTIFSATFHDMVNSSYCTPAKYVADTIIKSQKTGADDQNTCKEVKRCLRAFPSFLRELDLECGLVDTLQRRHLSAVAKQGAAEDIAKHTDVIIDIAGSPEMRLWSYMIKKGDNFYNLRRKVKGERGQLPDGIHVFCPYRKDDMVYCRKEYEWILFTQKYFDDVVDAMLSSKSDTYAHVMVENDTEFAREFSSIVKIVK